MRRVALIVIMSIKAAWAVDKDKGRFAPGPASSYPNRQTQEKITVAAVPYTTDAQAATAFGKVKPHEYGILPVLIVIQNDTGKALRVNLKAQYITSEGEHVDSMPAADVLRYQAIRKTPGMPKPSPLPIPLPSGNKKGPLNTPEIEGREFSVHLIPPGESAHGFVYFRAWETRKAMVYLTGLSDATNGQEYFFFEIPLDGK
jgi:hypothetical protein